MCIRRHGGTNVSKQYPGSSKPYLLSQTRKRRSESLFRRRASLAAKLAKSGNPFGNPKLFNDVLTGCKLLILMVGERGFEPPTPWSRTNNRCTNLLSRLGLFCVLYSLFP